MVASKIQSLTAPALGYAAGATNKAYQYTDIQTCMQACCHCSKAMVLRKPDVMRLDKENYSVLLTWLGYGPTTVRCACMQILQLASDLKRALFIEGGIAREVRRVIKESREFEGRLAHRQQVLKAASPKSQDLLSGVEPPMETFLGLHWCTRQEGFESKRESTSL